jgi:RNA polymerase sporulation-specific sigma factor
MLTNNSRFEKVTDEALVEAAQAGDSNALSEIFTRFERFVRAKASPYYLAGADEEDVIQEGRIGLLKAVRNFDGSRLSKFLPFADLCIKRQIMTAVKNAARKKHIPLNTYVSLDNSNFDEESDTTLLEVMEADGISDPEAIFIDRENEEGIRYIISKSLNPGEQEVLRQYLNGHSYKEIADKTGRTSKSVDNTLQRLKKKLKPIKP